MKVTHPEQHAHRHLSDVWKLLAAADLTDRQRTLANRIFTAVAHAEATVHGMSIDKVHFHEVGAIDSIVDIVGAAVGFDHLAADEVVCSPVPPGRGFVHIDHGICPVPAPGTAELLKGIPLADVPIEAELTTPTGAAIVRTLVNRFGSLPAMSIEQVGCGAGTMDFPQRANILRLYVGTITASGGRQRQDDVVLLETNLDDISPEVVGYTQQRLRDAGALDVWATSIQMKKGRPGVLLSVLSRPESVERMETILFSETGTLGIRRQSLQRSLLSRASCTVSTPWGEVAGKLRGRQTAIPGSHRNTRVLRRRRRTDRFPCMRSIGKRAGPLIPSPLRSSS